MACEKYSSWMIEAALDALSPQRQAEFSVHIAGCRRCHEEFDRARALSGVVDRGVAVLVANEPSTHFEAKVRARLAAEPAAQHVWRFGWAPVAALAAVLIAAVALLAIRIGQDRHNSPMMPLANSIASVDASNAQPPGVNRHTQGARSDSGEIVSESSPAPAAEASSRPLRSDATRGAEKAKLSPARERQPEVLVQPGQFAMIERYAEAAHEGRVDGTQIVRFRDSDDAALPGIDAAPLEVKDIEISPLKIQELPSSGDSDPSASPDSGKS